jgi:hypothetical protein
MSLREESKWDTGKRLKGKIKTTDFSCINPYKLDMMPELGTEVLFMYLKTLNGLLLDFCTKTQKKTINWSITAMETW